MVNIIVADDKATTEAALGCTLIEFSSENPAGIGWSFDEETGSFIDPNGIIIPSDEN